MDKMKFETPDMTAENIEKIAKLFPNCVTEMRDESGKVKRGINFEMLKQMLSPDVVDGDECYEFTWVGKKASVVEANKPIRKTLRPCPEESKDWDTTENLYIEGDNLEVLKLLQESYLGKVKMIYIDPPYNTGNDFIYADDFMRSQEEENEQMGMYDEDKNRLFKNTDSNGRFHSDWCSMIYPRLMLARNLLADDGVIFISIDDNEVDNLLKICDDAFGEQNFVAIINWKGRGGRQDSKYYAAVHEYIICYAKQKDSFSAGEEIKSGDVYPKFDKEKGRYYKTQLLRKWGSNSRREDRPNLYYPIIAPDGAEVFPIITVRNEQYPSICEKIDGCWRHGANTMKKNIQDGLVEFVKQNDGSWIPYEKIFAPLEGEEKTKKYTTWIDETNDGAKDIKNLFGSAVFDYPKSHNLLVRFLKMAGVEDGDIAMDFFSGSATTAHAVMQLNAEDGGHRKFIMVQLPEPCDEQSEAYKAGYKNICDIGKERIRRAGEKIRSENSRIDIYVSAIDEIVKNKSIKMSIESYVHEVKEKWIEDENDSEVQEDVVKQNIIDLINENDTLFDEISTYEQGGDKLSDLVIRLAQEVSGLTYGVDIGFRVLKLADSNMKDVYYAADEYTQSNLIDMISNIKDDRSDLDLLFGCLIDWGLPLSLPYTSEKIDGCTVHTYNDGDLIACFDENIPESVIREIARRKPLRAVFRDSGFADSPSKINVFEIFKLYMPEDADDISKRVRVI